MDVDVDPAQQHPQPLFEPGPSAANLPPIMIDVNPEDAVFNQEHTIPAFEDMPPQREPVKDLVVKLHVRRTGKDAWNYLGRGIVSQELGHGGQSSRVVVRSAASNKILTTFSEHSDLQVEKRGNFVVVSCVENASVVAWSLNTTNNSETLKLLATIELTCYKCRQALTDPNSHGKTRRRIERVIRDDRRRRHRRRREQEAMVTAFERQNIS